MARRKEGFSYVGKLVSNLINLSPVDFEDLKRVWGFEEELNQLHQSLAAIADLVEDAEQKQETMVDATRWLRNLKEVAYQADDLLSELSYQTTRLLQLHSFSSISRAIYSLRKAQLRRQLTPKLKKVNLSLQNIQRDNLSLQFTSIQPNFEDILSQDRLAMDLIVDKYVIERKTDVAKIVNLITSSYNQQHTFVVVPIIGVGGVGKTTLAKLVCQKVMSLTTKPFDVEIWVHVAGHFSEYRTLGEMLRSLNSSMGSVINRDTILRQLAKELVSKRFLLVLDDVCKNAQWNRFKTVLSRICRNNGNAILVTTRLRETDYKMATSPQHIHELNHISDDECWLILKERAFRKATELVPSIFEVIGRQIAKQCFGDPFFAKVLGAVMGFNMDEETWLKISDALVLNKDETDLVTCDRIFHHLPSYLKPCFAFCSIFPKDFLIRKEELIWLWMAEGIIDSWDTGSKWFDALLDSSIFQEVERDDYDDSVLCKMHDIVRDIALYFSRSRSQESYIYHLYACDPFVQGPWNKKLRTILLSDVPLQQRWDMEMLQSPRQEIWKLEMLRSLHLNGSNMSVLPSSIKKMKHLRYLDVSISKTNKLSRSITKLYNLQTLNLSNSTITELPEFITELFNLQTLKVSNSKIKELPESINKLQKLQTLDVSNSMIKVLPESITELCNLQTLKFLKCKELTELPRKRINNLVNLKHVAFSFEHQMPVGLGKLSDLQTLLLFVVGLDWGGSIEELHCLNKLRGSLKISRLEEVGDKEEVERANLQRKANLQGVCFEWSYGENDRSSRDEELLEGLQPHPNIQRIKIKYYMGENLPSWMLRMKNPGDAESSGVINNLVDLRLEWCCNFVELPRLGDLPHLQYLKMNQLRNVKRIGNEFYGIDSESRNIGCLRLFPALKSLSISWMENLIEWSSPSDDKNVVVFPCLENLSIQACHKLTGFPMSRLSELVKVEIRDCEELRLLTSWQQSFAFLTSLSLVGCSKFTHFRNLLQTDTCFMELSVSRCEWLTFIPDDIGKLTRLTSLEIYCCKRLRYFPGEILRKLTRLVSLSIGGFSKELDGFHYLNGIEDLPWLEELEIWGSDFFGCGMHYLPNQLQSLTVLKSLKIMGFTTMEELPEWLTNLQSLQSISFDYCKHLRCLSTATIVQHLPDLTRLNIDCCPILEESLSEFLYTTRIKVEFSAVSKVRDRLGY
ncbi:Disease resistance protein (CC-NBS-LRR class) family [Euphorbia peplus]|nr:Disease resistance protein (CC-NBS-LRR class) family [Euphorbia peplus]